MNEGDYEMGDPTAYLGKVLLDNVRGAIDGYPTTDPEVRAEVAEAVAKGLTEYAAELRS